MTIGINLLLVVAGLGLWMLPLTGNVARLNEVGKWTFIIALAVMLSGGR